MGGEGDIRVSEWYFPQSWVSTVNGGQGTVRWDGAWVVLTSGLDGCCKGRMVFGRYLPPGWAGAVRAGSFLGGQGNVWVVLNSGLGGHCKSGMVFGWSGRCWGGTYLRAGQAL